MPRESRGRNARTPIYVNGKPVYHVEGPLLRKNFRSNHILERPPGLAADVDVLRQAVALGALFAQFNHVETGDSYLASIEWLTNYGVYLDRGFGAQKVLPLEYWAVNGAEPSRRPRAIIEEEKAQQRRNAPQQMDLFAEAAR